MRRIRDGRSFCTRSVEAIQNDKVTFCMEISFHKLEPDAAVHQAEMPKVPHWSELACTKDAVPWIKEKVEREKIELPTAANWSLHQYDSQAVGEEDLFEVGDRILRPPQVSATGRPGHERFKTFG